MFSILFGMRMIIGLDFDNTIVNYDGVFHRVAVEKGLVPPETPVSKNAVRDTLRARDAEDAWTELQGYVYGCRMRDADCFPGVLDCLAACRTQGAFLYIVSHKTRTPYLGPAYDLHQAARDFLHEKGLLIPDATGLSPDRVFFELTKAEKNKRVETLKCDFFLDDLPEILAAPDFPKQTRPVLFDPARHHTDEARFQRVETWRAFRDLLFHREDGSS